MSDTNGFPDDFSLLRLVPPVLRARGFRLYTRGGAAGGEGKPRLVDLWQNGGGAILGHTPPLQLRDLKNAASRGLYAPFPHFLEARLFKALSVVFPGRELRLYASPPSRLLDLFAGGNAALWRPMLDTKLPLAVPEDSAPVLVPVVPGIHAWRLAKGAGGEPVALPHGLCAVAAEPGFALPPGDFLPPILLAASARGIHDLVAAAPGRAAQAFPRIAGALRGANPAWRRRGAYLLPAHPVPTDEWPALFRRFLDAGFLLPPVPCQPAILPGEMSPGEEAKLAALLSG